MFAVECFFVGARAPPYEMNQQKIETPQRSTTEYVDTATESVILLKEQREVVPLW